MKKLLLISIIGIIIVAGSYAQNSADSAMYNTGIYLLNNAKTTDNYLEAAFYFEQLAPQYPKQWLVFYYSGLAYLQASHKALISKYKDELIDKAQPLIDKAFSLKPNEPELHVLQAFLYQSRLQVNPEIRGLNYSQKAEASLKKAMAADPANPRAFSLMAYNVYFTPVMFGGGAKKALSMFLKAKEKFLAFTPELPFMPNWGEAENQQMIRECNQSRN
jgi:tetratricopeptide (TPR) repeat protein